MNVVTALWIVVIFGGIGGLIHGFWVYHGVILPKTFEVDVRTNPDDDTSPTYKMSLWVPGVVGEIVVGVVAAAIVLFAMLRPQAIFGLDQTLAEPLLFNEIGVLLAAGLTSTVVINKFLEGRGWDKIIAQTAEATAETEEIVTDMPAEGATALPEAVRTILPMLRTRRTVNRTVRRASTSPVLQATAGVRPWRYIQSLQG